MEYILLVLKGFFIGIAKIIPGVSGAMLAISMGVYERAMYSISNFFKDPISHFKFLCPLLFGAVVAVIAMSKLLVYLLNNYYLPTLLLFIGLMIGGIPSIYKKIDRARMKPIHFISIILSFLLIFILTFIGKQNYFLQLNSVTSTMFAYFTIGLIDAITMIIPGISGTAIMMILGCYHLLLNMLSSFSNLSMIGDNLILFIPFIVGIVLGILGVAKLMNYLFQRHSNLIYSSILGFATSSTIFLLFQTFTKRYSYLEILISLLLLLIGYKVSTRTEK